MVRSHVLLINSSMEKCAIKQTSSSEKPTKFISLFAGIGGFDLALERLGNECVYANEWDKYASLIYEQRFNRKIDTRDIRKVETTAIPDHELLCAGFPCQSFSIAGKRGGFSDTRGTLFFEIARILRDKRPRYLLLENVKGLLFHDSGKTIQTIFGVLTDLGYDLQWQVLNSKNFGVPQNRERIFIIGHLRGTSRPKVFPIRNCNSKTVSKTILDINQAQRVYGTEGLAITQKALGGGQGAKTGLYAIAWSKSHRTSKKETYRHNFGQIEHRIKTNGEFNTLSTGSGGGSMSTQNFIKEGYRIRRLTPLECERLQGFPDHWTKELSDTQRYKCLGNAVTVNVVYDIAKRLG